MKKRFFQLLLGLLLGFPAVAFAQAAEVDFMRISGKIYVVVAVIAAVFIGIIAYMVYVDRRLTKLENQTKEHDPT
jgi:CcmD family protein